MLHQNVIHPRFGNFVVLGTVVTQATVSAYGTEIDFNPCLECRLCVDSPAGDHVARHFPRKTAKVFDSGIGPPAPKRRAD